MPTNNPIMDHSRRARVAIGMLAQGIEREEIARQIGSIDTAIKDVLEQRLGFLSASELSKRFTGHSIICPIRGVYAIGAIGLSVVKVGWSDHVLHRMRCLSNCFPADLVLVGVLHSETLKTERLIHSELRKWKKRGEWFHFTNEVREFISSRFKITISEELSASIGVKE